MHWYIRTFAVPYLGDRFMLYVNGLFHGTYSRRSSAVRAARRALSEGK